MARKKSAGILMFRCVDGGVEVLLVHPGGPRWPNPDDGAWSIPKGEFCDDDDPMLAAQREFAEETGFEVSGEMIPLDPLRQPGGKTVYAWAVEGDLDPDAIVSNTFSMEWPPESGQRQEYPEVDRAQWFTIAQAKTKMSRGQLGLLDQLESRLQPRNTD